MQFKILIVEDDPILNDHLTFCLGKNYDVTSVLSVEEAINSIDCTSFHLLITDILITGKTGFDLLNYINDINLKLATIVISALEDNNNIIKCYDLGAVDFINKPINLTILERKINNLINTLHQINCPLTLDSQNLQLTINNLKIPFTKTEFLIFELLYSTPFKIFTKDDIINSIWFENDNLSNSIVEVNIFNIRQKLGSNSNIIKTKKGIGYYYEN